MKREFDVVVYGATGFTGRQMARVLREQAPAGTRIAVAGRDEKRLREIADGLDVVVADSRDPASVAKMCARTRVVAAMAGPYTLYGTPVVAGCVASGTHYVDITGETPWARSLIDKFHEKAIANKATIVPFCGYDSVPSDIGAFVTVKALRERFHEAPHSVEGFHRMKGGINGGTLATLIASNDDGSAKQMGDRFLLSPGFSPPDDVRRFSRDFMRVEQHAETGRIIAPFLMAQINTRVVRRSQMLLPDLYGSDFRYHEYYHAKTRAEAMVMAGGLAGMFGLAQLGVGRKLLKAVGPKPGEGPSERTMDQGGFKIELLGVGTRGGRVRAELSGRGDPGNRSTVRFCAAAALQLLETDAPYGLQTPASALGQPYVERLKRVGFTLTVK